MSYALELYHDQYGHFLIPRVGRIGSSMNLMLPLPFSSYSLDSTLLPEDPTVSRCHAVIHRCDENYFVTDCGSTNGTVHQRLGRERFITPNLLYSQELRVGDQIRVGRSTLDVTGCGDWTTCYALMLGGDEQGLLGVGNDLLMLSSELRKRRFAAIVLRGADTKKQSVLEKVRYLGCEMDARSSLWVHGSGHGSQNGFTVSDGIISPHELYGALRNVAGRKIVSVDACHSGTFLDCFDHEPLRNTLVIAASGTSQFAYENWSSLKSGTVGNLTYHLVRFLREYRTPNLCNVLDYFGHDVTNKLRDQGADLASSMLSVQIR